MLRFIYRHIITGIITILPVALTLYLLYWLAVSAETLLGDLIQLVLPEEMYRPGMGVAAGFLVVFLIGLLMHAYIVRWIFSKGEELLYHMPLVKSVYRAMRDFFAYFSPTAKKEFQQVVSVSIGDTGMEVIGFVTQDNPEYLHEDLRQEDRILVYIPLSYMIGGYVVLMPRSAVRPINMGMEEAMRFALTAGVTGGNR